MFCYRYQLFLARRAVGLARFCRSNRPRLAENNTEELLEEIGSALNDAKTRTRLSKILQSSDAACLNKVLHDAQIGLRKEPNSENIYSSRHDEIPTRALMLIAVQHGVPFLGFGFIDNAIMILAGDSIDITLGAKFGISSIAAAAIGNIFADVSGLGLSGIIEDKSAKLGIRAPLLSSAQLLDNRARFAKVFGRTVGVTLGCLLGMLPLLFLDTRSY